ncbi:MAG: DnaA regulatory inactivator Hda [Thiohalospira sp.]
MAADSEQLILPVGFHEAADLEGFEPGANAAAVAAVAAREPGPLFLWGGSGRGKTHLLQAACVAAGRNGEPVAYLPLSTAGLTPEALQGLEGMAVVAVDDLDAVAGDRAWEEALFHLFNRTREAGAPFLAAASAAPAALPLVLEDLRSRLAWGLVFHLQPLDDAGLCRALMDRARRRGMEMPEAVANYLLRRISREPAEVFAWLERLDRATLAAQRRLTIPFVRDLISADGG